MGNLNEIINCCKTNIARCDDKNPSITINTNTDDGNNIKNYTYDNHHNYEKYVNNTGNNNGNNIGNNNGNNVESSKAGNDHTNKNNHLNGSVEYKGLGESYYNSLGKAVNYIHIYIF